MAMAWMLVAFGFVIAAPSAAAHEDGCMIFEHTSPGQFHLVCLTSPNTCFVNAQLMAVAAHGDCTEPESGENGPCLLKLKIEDNWVKEC